MKMYQLKTYQLLFIIASLQTVNGLMPDQFISELQRLANDILGVNKFQTYQNSLNTVSSNINFKTTVPNGQDLAAKIASNIEAAVKNVSTVMYLLQQSIQDELSDPSAPLAPLPGRIPVVDCCNVTKATGEYDPNIGTIVDFDNMCVFSKNRYYWTDRLLPIFQENRRKIPMFGVQYVGFAESGDIMAFPSNTKTNYHFCPIGFNSLNRPWYTATTSMPKDIIILIDKSTAMADPCTSDASKKKIDVAKAVITSQIMPLLNANDRVAILAFNSTTSFSSVDSCFNRELAIGTTENLNNLKQFLMANVTVDPNDRSNLTNALRKAFDLFAATTFTAGMFKNNEKVILLLSDGQIKDQPGDVISTEIALFNNSVDLFVFGICQIDDGINQNLRSYTMGKGRYSSFSDQAKSSISFFYDTYLPSSSKTDLTFSLPFISATGNEGLVTGACLPLIPPDQRLRGTVCVDLKIDLLFQSLLDFKADQYSYMFLIDGRGRTMLHPVLPHPKIWTQLPIYLDLQSLEFFNFSAELKSRMLSGVSGNMSVVTSRFLANGEAEVEGVYKIPMKATYFWNPIPSMKFSLCLVIQENTTNQYFSGTPYPTEFTLADELDADQDSTNKCNHFDRLTNIGVSVLKLAPMAFMDPMNYTDYNISSSIPTFKLYIQGRTVQDQSMSYLAVKSGVREGVNATSYVDQIWMAGTTQDLQNIHSYVLSRFIATREGVYRQFPATRINKSYDPTQQPWYLTAAAKKGKLIVNKPRLGPTGSMEIVLSQTIALPSATSDISGVMGMSLSFSSFYNLVSKKVDLCSGPNAECFVIDSNGFVIMHNSFLSQSPVVNVHITTKAPDVASDLVNSGIMVNSFCVRYSDITKQLFWEITMSVASIAMPSSTIYMIDSTNIFIIVRNRSGSGQPGLCYCNNTTNNCLSVNIVAKQCECPCVTDVTFDRCSGKLDIDTVIWKPCFPSSTSTNQATDPSIIPVRNSVPSCVPCQLYQSEQDCTDNSCYWSNKNSSCNDTTNPKRDSTASTTSGFFSPPTISSESASTSMMPQLNSASSDGLKIGLGVGIPLGVLAVVIAVLCLVRCRNKNVPNERKAAKYPPKPQEKSPHITTIIVSNHDRNEEVTTNSSVELATSETNSMYQQLSTA